MIRDLAAVIMLCSFMSTHSGGFLHLIPDHRGEIRNISTPLINANAYKWKCLRFWYYIAIGKGQSLRVEVHSSSRAPMTIFHDSDVTRTFKFVQRPIYDWKALKVSWVRDKWATLHVYRTVTCVLLLSRTALYHTKTACHKMSYDAAVVRTRSAQLRSGRVVAADCLQRLQRSPPGAGNRRRVIFCRAVHLHPVHTQPSRLVNDLLAFRYDAVFTLWSNLAGNDKLVEKLLRYDGSGPILVVVQMRLKTKNKRVLFPH